MLSLQTTWPSEAKTALWLENCLITGLVTVVGLTGTQHLAATLAYEESLMGVIVACFKWCFKWSLNSCLSCCWKMILAWEMGHIYTWCGGDVRDG